MTSFAMVAHALRRFASLLLPGIAAFVVAAPAQPQAPEQRGGARSVRDSAGIEIVENRTPVWTEAAGWSVDPDPLVEVGAIDGAEPYLFQRVGQVLGLGGGPFAVVDGGAAEIRIFDREGSWVRTVGRRGEGPGEFSSAPRIALASPDTIVALDPGGRRLSRFLLDGTLLSDERIVARGGVGGPVMGSGGMPWRVLPTGEALAVAGTWTSAGGAGEDDAIRNLQYSLSLLPGPDTGPVSLGSHPSSRIVWVDGGSASDPFSPSTGMTLDGPPPTLSLVNSPRWELTEMSMAGATTRIVRIGLPRIAVTDDLVDGARLRIRERARDAGGDPDADLRAFALFEAPDSAPAVDGLHSDGRGTRFLRHWSPDDHGAGVRLEVVDGEGRWLGSLRLPPDAGRVVGVGHDRIFTEWRSELDVPYVRVYEIVRGG